MAKVSHSNPYLDNTLNTPEEYQAEINRILEIAVTLLSTMKDVRVYMSPFQPNLAAAMDEAIKLGDTL